MFKGLFNYKGSKKLMFIIGIVTILQAMAIIGQAVFLSAATTNLFHGSAPLTVLPLLLGFLLFFILRHLLKWLIGKISYGFADKTSSEVEERLVQKIFLLGPRTIGKRGSGNTVTLCLEGIPKFRTYLHLFIPRVLAVVIIPVILLIYIYTLDLLSTIVLILTMPILIIFLILLGFAAQKQIEAKMGTFYVLSRHFVDSLRGLLTLKYLGKSKSHKQAIEKVSNQYRKATLNTMKVAFLSTFSLDLFSSLSVAVLAVELGLRLIKGTMPLEPALTILILAPEYFLPIRSLSNDYHATMDGKESGKEIEQLLQQQEITSSNVDFPAWDENSVLSVKGLERKAEDGNRYLLKDISFEVKGFQKIGIVGASGAGKSTFIDLLSGLSHSSGGTFSINGTEFTQFSTEGWRKQISYIPQHPYIFSGTVRENMCWYVNDASDSEIKRVAEVVGLSDFVQRLPEGFDTKIGQGGRDISGGEEQRIALSRALLDGRNILLFDEPTAHLDIETEHDIKKVLLPLLKNKLVFFATHRLHWMKSMDVIFVLEGGRLVEVGSHDELLKKKGAYYKLLKAQGGTKE